MSEQRRDQLADLLASYRKQQAGLVDLHRRMKEISVTATSPRHEVSVTVSHLGGLEDIRFPTNTHRRLAPQELATLIMQTFREAKEKATEDAAGVLEPIMPAGLSARDLLSGRLGMDQIAPPDGPRMPDLVRQVLEA